MLLLLREGAGGFPQVNGRHVLFGLFGVRRFFIIAVIDHTGLPRLSLCFLALGFQIALRLQNLFGQGLKQGIFALHIKAHIAERNAQRVIVREVGAQRHPCVEHLIVQLFCPRGIFQDGKNPLDACINVPRAIHLRRRVGVVLERIDVSRKLLHFKIMEMRLLFAVEILPIINELPDALLYLIPVEEYFVIVLDIGELVASSELDTLAAVRFVIAHISVAALAV